MTNEQQTATQLLGQVPGIAEVRINSLMSALTQQRDTASNAASSLAAEIEVYRHAADFYQQQALGMQAQLAMLRADMDVVIADRERLFEKVDMITEDLYAAQHERDTNRDTIKELVDIIGNSGNLKECLSKSAGIRELVKAEVAAALIITELPAEDVDEKLPEGTF